MMQERPAIATLPHYAATKITRLVDLAAFSDARAPRRYIKLPRARAVFILPDIERRYQFLDNYCSPACRAGAREYFDAAHAAAESTQKRCAHRFRHCLRAAVAFEPSLGHNDYDGYFACRLIL